MSTATPDQVAYDPNGAIAEVRAALGASKMTARELWFAYIQVGGDMHWSQFLAALAAESLPSKLQYELISQALNEHFRTAG